MNSQAIRYFIEVANTLSFTKASNNLYISQPGISQQIDALEKSLGVKLLQRTTRKVKLTEEGEYLYKQAAPCFNTIDNILNNLKASGPIPTKMKLATVPSAASLFLPKVFSGLNKMEHHIEFTIQETTSVEALKLISKQQCHLGFVQTSKFFSIDKHEFDFLTIDHSVIKAIISAKHRLANKSSIDLSELADDYFLHYDQNNSLALSQLLDDCCKSVGFTPKILCSGPELLTISNLIAQNAGVTLMPESMYQLIASPKIVALELENINYESSITVVWKKSEYISKNMEILINIVERIKQRKT